MSPSSRSRQLIEEAPPGRSRRACRCHSPTKSGSVLRVVPMSSTCTPGHAQADDRARGGHAVVVVAAETPAVQGCRRRCAARPRSRSPASPRPPSSAVRAARRSVSCPRMWATPRIHVGVDARAARAATVGVSSAASCRSMSMPTSSPLPTTVRPGAVEAHVGAHRVEDLAQEVAGLGRVLRPAGHAHRAAGDERRRDEGPGVGQVGLDRHVEGVDLGRLDTPRVGLAVVDDRARVAQRLDRHEDVGLARHRLAVVVHGDAVVVARAGEQERRDELRRGRGVHRHRRRRARDRGR